MKRRRNLANLTSKLRPTEAKLSPLNRPSSTSDWQLKLAGILVLATIALIVYWPSLHGDFVLDDDLLLTDNHLVQSSDGLYRIWFTSEPVDYWPLTNSVFWIQWRLWGLNPTGYHVVNLLLHIAGAVLLWTILKQLAIPGAYLAALLFTVHPINVESVAWIAQLKNVLSMCLFLLSILCYLHFDARAPNDQRKTQSQQPTSTRRATYYTLSFAAFVLAMLSKGSVAVLPVLLLLIVWWRYGRLCKHDVIRTAPFFVMAIGLTLVNIWFQSHGNVESIRGAGFIERLLGAGAVIWFYLCKALLPINLAFIYSPWHIDPSQWQWWLPLFATAAVTAILVWQRRHTWVQALLLAWAFFCISLLPVMGFVDVSFMKTSLVADHYQHISLLTVVSMVAAAWFSLMQRSTGPARTFAQAVAAATVILLACSTWQQSKLYASPLLLYEDTLQKNPDCVLAHDNLAITFAKSGQLDQAIAHSNEALRIKPDDAFAHNNLGLIFTNCGRLPEAIDHLELAIRSKPNDAVAYYNYGNALVKLNRIADAIQRYQEAVRYRPHYAAAWNNLAAAYADLGQWPNAVATAETALKLANSLGKNALAQRLQIRLMEYKTNQSNSANPNSNSEP